MDGHIHYFIIIIVVVVVVVVVVDEGTEAEITLSKTELEWLLQGCLILIALYF